MKKYQFTIAIFSLFFFSLPLSAQFFLNGSAIQLNDTCYQLTAAQNSQVGSIWNPDKINLNQSFDVVMTVNFGCKDRDGADGIVFGFQPVSTSIGSIGEGIGFENIVPSIGIEMDTWQNLNLNDPVFDHIAIIKNGNLNHSTPNTLAGPIQTNPHRDNVEDCRYHDLRVSWDALLQTLEVSVDCDLRLSYTGDIVNEIFNGDPEVFWGFTSATGGANNIHEICFQYTTFLDAISDETICPGGSFKLQAKGGERYLWQPGTGLSDSTISNPIASPQRTTDYVLTVFDDCDRPFYDSVRIAVEGDSVFFDLGIDTLVCENAGFTLDATTSNAIYKWSDGSTGPTLPVTQEGDYSVTVSKTDIYCVADDETSVAFIPAPSAYIGKDTTLCEGQKLRLEVELKNATYRWQDGSYLPTYTVLEQGQYIVTVSNECGEAAAAINIGMEDCHEIYLPTAFSPNGDDFNDWFYPQDGGDVILIHSFHIYDRWGTLVFENFEFSPNQPEAGWDGNFNSASFVPGVFAYILDVEFKDGTREWRSGEVLLVR